MFTVIALGFGAYSLTGEGIEQQLQRDIAAQKDLMRSLYHQSLMQARTPPPQPLEY